MGEANPRRASLYSISLETFVPDDHPLRRIRPLLDDQAIRRACRALYAPISRPSVAPERLLLALVGGYLLQPRHGHQKRDVSHGFVSSVLTLNPALDEDGRASTRLGRGTLCERPHC